MNAAFYKTFTTARRRDARVRVLYALQSAHLICIVVLSLASQVHASEDMIQSSLPESKQIYYKDGDLYGNETLARPGIHTNLAIVQRRIDNGRAVQREIWLAGSLCRILQRDGPATNLDCISDAGWPELRFDRETLYRVDGQYTRYGGTSSHFDGLWAKNQAQHVQATGHGFLGSYFLTVNLARMLPLAEVSNGVATLRIMRDPQTETRIRFDINTGLILEKTAWHHAAILEHSSVRSSIVIDPTMFHIASNQVVDLHEYYGIQPSKSAGQEPLVGVGVVIRRGSAGCPIVITRVLEGSAAASSNIQAGDCLISIDGRSLSQLCVSEVASLMRGPEGTKIDLVIMRKGRDITLTITRSRVQRGGKESAHAAVSAVRGQPLNNK